MLEWIAIFIRQIYQYHVIVLHTFLLCTVQLIKIYDKNDGIIMTLPSFGVPFFNKLRILDLHAQKYEWRIFLCPYTSHVFVYIYIYTYIKKKIYIYDYGTTLMLKSMRDKMNKRDIEGQNSNRYTPSRSKWLSFF